MAYRCLYIESNADLSYSQNHLIIKRDGEVFEEFLDDVDTVMINSLQTRLSSYLLNELCKRNIRILFSDERHNPSYQLLPINATHDAYSRFREQLVWNKNRKDILWMEIVKNKISNQGRHLVEVGKKFRLRKYIDRVEIGDLYNVEAFAARSYFMKLFGKDFSRKKENLINPALNYGYTILLSLVNRAVASFGYSSKFGIHHNCATNNFNFSCDIMEPFRIIIDKIVFKNKDRQLDSNYKKILIDVNTSEVTYKNKKCRLDVAINSYTTDIIKFLNGKRDTIEKVIC